MISVLTGNNDYLIQATQRQLADRFDGMVEKHDGDSLDLNQLADLLAGGGLFAEKKLVIITELSKNKPVFAVLPDWLGRVDDDTELILIEPKLDKRTATYKSLKSSAEIREFSSWTDRDQGVATKWVIEEAKSRGLDLAHSAASELVRRSMVSSDKPGRSEIDQWRLHFGIDKLRVVDEVTPAVVAELIDADPRENSFELLDAALSGDQALLQRRLANLKTSEEPHRLFGLLSQQVYQLTVLAYADKPAAAVAKDLGTHPFVVEKLQTAARRLGKRGARELALMFADVDVSMKTSTQDPWALVESALLKVAVWSSAKSGRIQPAKAGFTIVEVIIVIVVVGILAAILVASHAGSQQRAALSVARADMQAFSWAAESFRVQNNTAPMTNGQFGEIMREAGLYESTRTDEKSYAICAADSGYALVAWNPIVDGWHRGDTLYMFSSDAGQEVHTLTNSSLNSANQLSKICDQVHSVSTFDIWTYDVN